MNRSKKQTGWKGEQSKRKLKENRVRLGLGIGFLSVIFGLVLIGFLWKKARNSIWDGQSRLVVVSQFEGNLKADVLLPEQKRRVEFKIPSELVVKVPFEYGEYQVGKVFELGELDGVGGKLLTRSTQNLLGVEVVGFRIGNKTNLTWWDSLRWKEQIWFRSKKTSSINLANSSGISEVTLGDDTKAYEAREILIDELINLELFDQRVVKERLSVAIVNATGVSGIAHQTARIMTNLGGEVNLVTNQDIAESSVVVVRNKDLIRSETVKGLVRLLSVTEVKVEENNDYRAEVVVVIGKDYVRIKD